MQRTRRWLKEFWQLDGRNLSKATGDDRIAKDTQNKGPNRPEL